MPKQEETLSEFFTRLREKKKMERFFGFSHKEVELIQSALKISADQFEKKAKEISRIEKVMDFHNTTELKNIQNKLLDMASKYKVLKVMLDDSDRDI